MLKESKVDVYIPKKMKHRMLTHERVKHKREARQLAKEQAKQRIPPNA